MSRTRSALPALVLGAFAALILSTHVFVALDQIRVKVVQSPTTAREGRIVVPTTDFGAVNGLRTPFALIARLTSGSTGTSHFLITIDGARVCDPQIAGGASRRVDCAVAAPWNPWVDHQIVIQGPSTNWTLDYLELATHHGNTSGVFTFVILPGSSDHFRRPSAGWIGGVSLLLTVMWLVPTPMSRVRWLRRLYAVVVSAVLVLWALAECSQWLSNYRIVLSAGTFARSVALLVAPQLCVLARWSMEPRRPPVDWRVAVLRAGLVSVLVLGGFNSVALARLRDFYGGNYSGFFQISKRQFDSNPLLNTRADVRTSLLLQDAGGYDGEFLYFATFDPFLRAYKDSPSTYRRIMDAPPYRYGRIGFSLLAHGLAAGDWRRYPVTMMWLILGSLSMVALVLALMAEHEGLTPAVGGLVLIIPGFWQSLQFGLPEPVAAAAFVGGVFCLTQRRTWLAGALFALSLLVRETGLVAVGCIVIGALLSGRRRAGMIVGTLAISALFLWRLYVAWRLFPDWGLEGFFFHPPDLGWPFAGFVDLWQIILRGEYYPGVPEMSLAGLTYPVVITAGLALAVALVLTRPAAVHFAALAYGLIAVSLNFPAIWANVANGQRGTFELFLMFALSTVAIRSYPTRIRVGLLGFWSVAAAYVFFWAFDATYIRLALTQTLFDH